MTLYRRLIATHRVPWRIRHSIKQWVEHSVASTNPALYRWLHFGQVTNPMRAVTHGPHHHFFGYYDKSPWNGNGRYLLAHEVNFNDRAPQHTDNICIGVVDLHDGNTFLRLTDSRAWNWQQGAMCQWHPANLDQHLVYNDRRDGRFVGVVHDLDRGEVQVQERPIYAILANGETAFSLNFSRLAAHRPGYGYAGVEDEFGTNPRPQNDGIWRLDLASGRSDLIVSLADLASLNPKPSMGDAWHYVNHIQPSRNGKRIAFFHIWHGQGSTWEVRLYTCRPDGTELRCLLDTGFISHYDWRDDDTILVWANRPQATARFLVLSHLTSEIRTMGEETLQEDGHCTFSPDSRWILNDTYPDAHDMRTLMVIRTEDETRIDIARVRSPKSRWWGEIRCDLHPRWSRDGQQVCIDSVHEGSRQMYIVNMESFLQ